jgi:hypothetical protein
LIVNQSEKDWPAFLEVVAYPNGFARLVLKNEIVNADPFPQTLFNPNLLKFYGD